MPTSRAVTALAAFAAASLLLTGCGSEPDAVPTPQAPPVDATPAGYLDAIEKAAPGTPEKRAVSSAENTCADLKDGKDDATVIKNLAARLEVSSAVAKKALPVIRQHYCPQ